MIPKFAGFSVISFYTRHWDPNGINLDYAYAKFRSTDDHVNFGNLHRITTQSENPQVQFVAADRLNPTNYLQGVFIGDYTAIAMGWDLRFHPCWTDFRGNPGINNPNQDAYSQSISFFDDGK